MNICISFILWSELLITLTSLWPSTQPENNNRQLYHSLQLQLQG